MRYRSITASRERCFHIWHLYSARVIYENYRVYLKTLITCIETLPREKFQRRSDKIMDFVKCSTFVILEHVELFEVEILQCEKPTICLFRFSSPDQHIRTPFRMFRVWRFCRLQNFSNLFDGFLVLRKSRIWTRIWSFVSVAANTEEHTHQIKHDGETSPLSWSYDTVHLFRLSHTVLRDLIYAYASLRMYINTMKRSTNQVKWNGSDHFWKQESSITQWISCLPLTDFFSVAENNRKERL